MRCRLISTVAGLLCAAGFVQAQDFAPKPLQPISISSVAPAPLPATIYPIIPASARAVATSNCAGPVVAYGDGCAAPSSHHKAHDRNRSSVFGKLLIGAGTINPVSCGCLASERTFIFGSCKQFYNPTQECHGGGGCWPVDRRPPGLGVTSYLNR